MDIKVSVITPLYRGEQFIPQLIGNIMENAKHVSLEYILVNDSPKQYLLNQEILMEQYQLDGRLQLKAVNNPHNLGIQGARIAGLKQAEGEYVLFLDQDDVLEGNAVRTLLSCMEQGQYDVVAANGYRRYPAADGQYKKLVPIYARKAILKEVGRERMYLYGTDLIFSPGQCLIRKKAIPEAWCEKFLKVNGCDDLFLWLLLFQKNCRIKAINDKIYYHNETSRNYSGSYKAMEQSFFCMCDLLEGLEGYDPWKIKVLRRRYQFKSLLKSNAGFVVKCRSILRNLDILSAVGVYKLKGYD